MEWMIGALLIAVFGLSWVVVQLETQLRKQLRRIEELERLWLQRLWPAPSIRDRDELARYWAQNTGMDASAYPGGYADTVPTTKPQPEWGMTTSIGASADFSTVDPAPVNFPKVDWDADSSKPKG